MTDITSPGMSAVAERTAAAARANRPLRVLCLDMEGGFGGSSRSLFESLRHMPADIQAEVWCRKDGPIHARYAEIGIPTRIEPGMPNTRALHRLSRNMHAFGRFFAAWPRSRGFRSRLEEAARQRFDVVHFNHESLFWLARWLRRRLGPGAALSAHVRTPLPRNRFARWQYAVLRRAVPSLIFITEKEKENLEAILGTISEGQVIYNIVSVSDARPDWDALADDPRFKVASVSNYAWERGGDRLIDVARQLRACGRTDILFVMAGRMAVTSSPPGDLGEVARRGGTLRDYAELRGVADMMRFLGHVPDPGPVLTACDLLVRPSRAAEPWGREVLEAMAHGLPVIATGDFTRFVEPGVTGFLHPEFDAEAVAREIAALADDRPRTERMGRAARARVETLCHGPSRAEDLAALWRGLVCEGAR